MRQLTPEDLVSIFQGWNYSQLPHPPSIYLGSVDPNSSPLVRSMSSLTTEQSPSPQLMLLLGVRKTWTVTPAGLKFPQLQDRLRGEERRSTPWISST